MSFVKKHLFILLIILIAFLVRILFLDIIPYGFNWDETAYAYNAYSLRMTGADEYGVKLPLFLQSFGDYKPALLSYILALPLFLVKPSVILFRLIIILIAILGLVAGYGLILKLTKNNFLALLFTLLLALTPWHIHYSRAVMDPILSFSLMLIGFYFWLEKNKLKKIGGAAFLVLAMYSYNAARFLLPILILLLFFLNIKDKKTEFKKNWQAYVLLILGTVLILTSTLWSKAGSRAQQVFFPQSPEFSDQINERLYRSNVLNLPLNRVLNNKLVLFTYNFCQKYLSHFSPEYLFFGQTLGPRHGFDQYSNLLLFSLPLLILGLSQAVLSQKKLDKFFLAWLLLAPLASSLTTDTPHSGRTLIMLPAIIFLVSLGFLQVINFFKKYNLKPAALKLMLGLLAINFVLYFNNLYLFYPEGSVYAWQGHLKEASLEIENIADQYQQIYFFGDSNFYIFYSFYNLLPPQKIQQLHQEQGQVISQIDYLHIQEPNDDFLACALLEDKSLIVTIPGQFLEQLLPLKQLTYFNRFHSPQPSLNFYNSDQISSQNKAYLQSRCK